MITNFKLFEKIDYPKFKKGDVVYTITGKKGIVLKVHKGYYNKSLEMYEPHRYTLNILPHLTIRENGLKPEFEADSEKYNL